MSKLSLLAAAAAGYVLGARAGRQRYEQIAATARKVADNPKVQRVAHRAQDAADSAGGRRGRGREGQGVLRRVHRGRQGARRRRRPDRDAGDAVAFALSWAP